LNTLEYSFLHVHSNSPRPDPEVCGLGLLIILLFISFDISPYIAAIEALGGYVWRFVHDAQGRQYSVRSIPVSSDALMSRYSIEEEDSLNAL